MPVIADVVLDEGAAVNGATVTAWKASRFGGVPGLNAAPPAGTADAGPVTTGTSFGSGGSFQITVPTEEDYYVSAVWGSKRAWKFYAWQPSDSALGALPGRAQTWTAAQTFNAGTLLDKGSQVFDVKAYGAAGDGTTDDTAAIQAAINAANTASGGAVYFPTGTYRCTTSVTVKSNVTLLGLSGNVTLKQTTAGADTLTATGTLTNVSILGLSFDMTGIGHSAIVFTGSDAGGQVSNLRIRDCSFKNPSSTWMLQINYTIVDPAIPTSKNSNIRIEDCVDDATGQTSSLENWIFVNCQDLVLANNRLSGAPATLGAQMAIYGYCTNVRFIANYVQNWASVAAVYLQQSDTIQFLGDQFRTTSSVICIVSFNSQDVSILGCDMKTGASGVGVRLWDTAGTTFDGHTNLYNVTSNLKINGCRFAGVAQGVSLDMQNTQGQTDIFVEGCQFEGAASGNTQLFSTAFMPATPSATVKRISIRNNHISNHRGATGAGCISLVGHASAPNGGYQTLVIAGNVIAASGVASGTDIEVVNLADDVWVFGNRVQSPAATAIQVATACTNVRLSNNNGYNPVGAVTVAVPATGVAVAAQPYDRTFYITTGAGTTTVAIQNGPTITLQASIAGHAVRVPAGKTMTPTYTNAPTWVVEGE